MNTSVPPRRKAERLRLETIFTEKRDVWEAEHKLDEVVDVNDIAVVVAQWTGIPVSQMMETESEKLLHMEDRLHEHIIGQDEAIHAISDAIRRARSGMKDPRRLDRLVHLHRPFRGRQDRVGQSAGRIHVR